VVKSLRDIWKREGKSWKKIGHSCPNLECNDIIKEIVKIKDIEEET
jgi:hypothetical protein